MVFSCGKIGLVDELVAFLVQKEIFVNKKIFTSASFRCPLIFGRSIDVEKPLDRRQDKKVVARLCRSFLFEIFNSQTEFTLTCYRK